MKCQKIYLLWVLLLIGYIPLFAVGQKAHTNPSIQIMQPSSEAQSLGDFAEIPVDLYTGRININIPLFTISYKDIEVPVSLSYHGGGIKVDDECGAVGLGWTLNAGGVVNRILRGMPDELSESDVAGYDNLNKLDNQIHTFIQKMEYKTKGINPANIAWDPTPEEKSLLKLMTNYVCYTMRDILTLHQIILYFQHKAYMVRLSMGIPRKHSLMLGVVYPKSQMDFQLRMSMA